MTLIVSCTADMFDMRDLYILHIFCCGLKHVVVQAFSCIMISASLLSLHLKEVRNLESWKTELTRWEWMQRCTRRQLNSWRTSTRIRSGTNCNLIIRCMKFFCNVCTCWLYVPMDSPFIVLSDFCQGLVLKQLVILNHL